MKPLVIDLYCGTKSLKKPAEDLGMLYFGVDNNQQFEPDLVTDIYTLSANELTIKIINKFGEYQRPYVVWASPPCTYFSVASIGKYWENNPYGDPIAKTSEAEHSVRLVAKTLFLFSDLFPSWWYLENPRGMLRKFEMMKNTPYRNTVTYCQYGETRMKPTDIWNNNPYWHPKPACKNGDPCHDRAPRGSRQGTQGIKGAINRGKIPYALLHEILESHP